jgi:hypothetical protein
MDKSIRRVTDFKAQQQETYRYWQGRTAGERMDAVAEIVCDVYWMKGIDIESLPMDKTIVRTELANAPSPAENSRNAE